MRGPYSDLLRHRHTRDLLLLILNILLIIFVRVYAAGVTTSTVNISASRITPKPSQFTDWVSWREDISQIPTPSEGCFVAIFPSAVWQPNQCVRPPKEHSIPSTASQFSATLQPSTVGNSNDWVAQAPPNSTIRSSFGTFSSVSGLTNESDLCVAPFLPQCGGVNGGHGANFFSIQDNTNFGFPVDYDGRSTTGWEQFLYANGGNSGVVYIEYWLLNYGNCPPASQGPPGGGVGWFSFGGNSLTPASCVFNTDGTPTPFEPITDLSKLSLQSYANFGGNDEVMLCVSGGDCYATSVTDTVLHLYQRWTDSEFNVFGYGNGAQAQFNSGTTITVRNLLFDSDARPIRTTCVNLPGYTGETNNLDLVSCSTPTTTSLASITFTETNDPILAITVASSPVGSLYVTGSGFVTVDGVPVTTPDTFSWIEGSTHSIAAVSPVSCGAQCRYVFTGWSDRGDQSHNITVSGSPYPTDIFLPTYTATYQKQYYLTMQVSGPGSITLDSGWYNDGTTLTLIALANPQHAFKSWMGTGSGSYTGTENDTTIIVNGPVTESAYFS